MRSAARTRLSPDSGLSGQPAVTRGRNSEDAPPRLATAQKVEVAASVGLQDVLVVEPRITSWRQGWRPESPATPRHFRFTDQQIQLPVLYGQADAIAGVHQPQRPAPCGTRRDMPNHRAEPRATHARI